MFKFLDLEPESFGLDISDSSLKIVRLKKKGRFLKLASWADAEIKEGVIEEGEIKDEDALVKEIAKVLQKVKGEKLGTKKVIAALPENKAFFQIIKMPKMAEKDLQKALPFEVENHIPLPIEKAYLDFQIISENNLKNDYFNVFVVAIPKIIVDSYFYCLKKAGLTPQALEVESQSIVRALVKNEISPDPILILDFGKSTTSFIIFQNSFICFTSSIAIGSDNLTESIAKELKIDIKEAERLKVRYGLKGFKDREFLEEIVNQIKKYFIYYQGHYKDKKIKKIIFCGGGANLKGLLDFFAQELKNPVEIGNPWVNILPESFKEVPELSFKESISYAAALGLALRGIKK